MEKRTIIISIILSIVVYIIGIALSYYSYLTEDGIFGFDYNIYHTAVSAYWRGESPYSGAWFFYLNYFFYLCAWMYLLPFMIGMILHIIITEIMFYYILRDINTAYHEGWYYGNVIVIIGAFITLNTDIWSTFAFFMYLKYRDKWYSPFFFFLSFFKATAIIAAALLYIVNLIFEKKFRWNQIPAFVVVLGIVLLSYLTSEGLHEDVAVGLQWGLLVQMPHLMWWSISLFAFTQYKQYSKKTLTRIWVGYCICQLAYGSIWLIWFFSVG